MTAADLAAGRDVEPPSDLIAVWDWRDLGTPPYAGGLADQPAGLLRRGQYLEAVYTVMKRWYTDGAKSLKTAADKRLFERVLKLRRERSHADTR